MWKFSFGYTASMSNATTHRVPAAIRDLAGHLGAPDRQVERYVSQRLGPDPRVHGLTDPVVAYWQDLLSLADGQGRPILRQGRKPVGAVTAMAYRPEYADLVDLSVFRDDLCALLPKSPKVAGHLDSFDAVEQAFKSRRTSYRDNPASRDLVTLAMATGGDDLARDVLTQTERYKAGLRVHYEVAMAAAEPVVEGVLRLLGEDNSSATRAAVNAGREQATRRSENFQPLDKVKAAIYATTDTLGLAHAGHIVRPLIEVFLATQDEFSLASRSMALGAICWTNMTMAEMKELEDMAAWFRRRLYTP